MPKLFSALLALVLLTSFEASAAKRLGGQGFSYFPSFGLGSTSSVAYTGTAGRTFALLSGVGEPTVLVRVLTTTAAYIAVGASPTAVASDMLLPANTETILEIPDGYKVSAVPLSSSGTLYATLLTVTPGL